MLEALLIWYIKVKARKYIMGKLKAYAAKKIKASFGSTTMAVAALTIGVGVWVQQNPDVINALVPENYEGLALAVLGVVVALARMRTVDKSSV